MNRFVGHEFWISCESAVAISICFTLHQYPLDMDVVIDMTEDGIRLLFDPKNQRLKVLNYLCMISHACNLC